MNIIIERVNSVADKIMTVNELLEFNFQVELQLVISRHRELATHGSI